MLLSKIIIGLGQDNIINNFFIGGDFISDQEKDLYPYIKNYLIQEKNCLNENSGYELALGSKFRADVYGIDSNNKNLYLLEGKLFLDKKPFGNVIFESIICLEFADYVYVFGKKVEEFETKNQTYINECIEKGLGILLIDENKEVQEYLKPKKIYPEKLSKKEALYKIFNRTTNKSIADFILQAFHEYTQKHNVNCAKFIDIYNELFSDTNYKEILRKIIKGNPKLIPVGMRKAFQQEYGSSYYVKIVPGKGRLEDQICVNEKTEEKAKPPILLD